MSSIVEQHLSENVENVFPIDDRKMITKPQSQGDEDIEEEQKQQPDDSLHDSTISSPSIVQVSEPETNECPYTIVPIEGMEFIQRNFAKYNLGDKSAEEFACAKRLTLAMRFQLLERGFLLKLKNEHEYRNQHKTPSADGTEVKLIVEKN